MRFCMSKADVRRNWIFPGLSLDIEGQELYAHVHDQGIREGPEFFLSPRRLGDVEGHILLEEA